MEALRDLFRFLWLRRKFWLIPVVLVLIIVGALVILGGNSAAAPFIYSLF